MRILSLSISMGAGHIKAAEALKEYVDVRYPKSKNLIIDTLRYVNPLIHKIVVGGYLAVIHKKPMVYGGLYKMSEYGGNINKLSQALGGFMSTQILRLINDFKPNIIVCTHPFPLQMVAHLKKQNKINVPAIAILTDFVDHPLWHHDNIEAYIVAHDYIKSNMLESGVDKRRVFDYGIPVSRAFLENIPKNKARKQLNLEDTLTVLLMGGSLGMGDIENYFRCFSGSKKNLQIITVTGQNSLLKKRIEMASRKCGKPTKLFGYTPNIARLMDCSDFIATKPGGMTISEAFVKSLPIFIITPIPGQEQRNTRFLLNSGAAVKINKDDNIDSLLLQTFENPLRYKHMVQMATHLSKPNSGHNIVNLMEKLVHDHKKLHGYQTEYTLDCYN